MQIKRYLLSALCGCIAAAFLLGGCEKKEGKEQSVSQLNDLNSPRYVIGGMTGIVATDEARKAFPKANFLEYPMPIDGFTALVAGKIDAMVLDRPTLEFMAIAHPELIVMPQDLAVGSISVAVAKDHEKLLREVNEFIRKYRADGTYMEMCRRWFRAKDPDMPKIPSSKKDGVPLKVGITANNEPLCFLKNMDFAGFDTEFSLRLGAFLGKKVEFFDMPYDALVMALESGRIDVAVAYMDAMPEREDSVSFSENYIDSPISVIVRRSLLKSKNFSVISRLSDLDAPDRSVAVMSEILATREAKRLLPDAEYLEFPNVSDCYIALSSGKAHAVVYDRPALEYAATVRPDFMVLPENLASGHISVVAALEKRKLMRKVDAFIDILRKDGTMREMYDRWIRSVDPVMPEIGISRISGEYLVVGIDTANPPLCYVKNGKPFGYDIEFSERLALYLDKQIKYVILPFEGLLPALKSGKIDLAIAQMDATPERKESVLFSKDYIDAPIAAMILAKNYGGGHATQQKNVSVFSGNIRQWFKNGIHSLGESFEKTFVREMRWKLILQGLATTLVITVFAVLLGTVLAFPVCMMSRSRRKILAFLADRYVSIIMGTPILVILMILYYVLFAKVDISGILVAIFAFALDFAAYTSVTLRSGIDGIPRGQMEAALALGHTPFAAFIRFVLPQAVRTILPVYRGEVISTLKATSIVGYIAIMDLTKMGDIIRSRTYEAFFPLVAIALIYFLTAKGLTAILQIFERRLDPNVRRAQTQKRGVK